MSRRGILACLSLFCLLLAAPTEAMDIHDVIGLVQAGIDDDTIMAIVRKTGATFPLSDADRHQLSAAGRATS